MVLLAKSKYPSTHVHGTASNKTSLNKLVRVLPHDLTVLAGTRLALVSVDNQVSRGGAVLPALGVHEGPLHSTGETSTTASSQTGGLDLGDDPVMSLDNHFLGLVPVTVLHGALEVGAVVAVQVGEDAILVLQAALAVNRRRVLDSGHAALLLAILGGSRLLRGGGGEGANGGLVEGGAGGGRGAKSGLCRGGQHCGGSQCGCVSNVYERLRRLDFSQQGRSVLELGWSGEVVSWRRRGGWEASIGCEV